MMPQPTTRQELREALARAHSRSEAIEDVDLRRMREIVDYTPADMTVTVESGRTLADLQETLATHRQWLPLDPANPDKITINDLLAHDLSGPRRFGYGTVREHLLGVTVALADGRLIKNGGKVVKNVAGYDLCKLFVGHQNTLGIIVDATFKLRPRPEDEKWLCLPCATFASAETLLEKILRTAATPVSLDLHNSQVDTSLELTLGFAGTREEVQWQLEQLDDLSPESRLHMNPSLPSGGNRVTEGVKEEMEGTITPPHPGPLPQGGDEEKPAPSYYEAFWNMPGPLRKDSVLPSHLIPTLQRLSVVKFVAHAGNGVIYYRGGEENPKPRLPTDLMQRIKQLFDPKQILPRLPW